MTEASCDVWVAELAQCRAAHDALLEESERIRAEAFLRHDDRSRFVLGVALLKLAVAHATSRPVDSVRVDRRCPSCGGPHGRPRLPGSGVHASVSHAGTRVVVALTGAGAVGIDLEPRATTRALPPARHVLARSEPLERPEDLLTYWCRKESVVKATGDGWRVPFPEVVVSAPRDRARLLRYRGNSLSAFMTDLDVGDGCAAALTVLFSGCLPVHIRDAVALLGD